MQIVYLVSSIIIVLLVWFYFTKKHFEAQKKEITESKYQLLKLVQTKYDLIPAIIELVRSHTDKHEEIIMTLISKRSEVVRDIKVDQSLESEIKKVLDLGKIYKNLAIDTRFLDVKNQLNEIEQNLQNLESKISENTKRYNDSLKKPFWFFVYLMPRLKSL